MVIYITTNLINNKRYIGKDKHNNPQYLGSGKYICQAICKYGKDNFKKEIIEECSSYEQMCEREVYWIKYYNAALDRSFYNIAEENYGAGNFKGWTEDNWLNFSKKMSNINIESYIRDPNRKTRIGNTTRILWDNIEYRQTHSDGVQRWWDNATNEEKELRRQQKVDWWKHNKRELNNGGRPPKTILSYEDMIIISDRINNGESGRTLAEEYNTTGYMIDKMLSKYKLNNGDA